ncbi:DUF4446 family protein [Desulfosporosinus sp. Sb-LF]|uniref:DUF4446 family protein n=1 Tax=Desulfosporosinus sp. Sb-LF TaxID=2560027 RepID=UPI00107F3F65|nr:DUF4446 family protein [Desulfosporosinus sp. Sb-LF]TGE34126.1 DUF4446 family protein [Desulfosporosinus sp. Sb-LF]
MPLHWWAITVLAILLLISLIATFALLRRMRRFEASYVSLQTFMSGLQLETLLQDNIERVAKQEQKQEEYDARLNSVEKKLRASVDHVELIRFRAFENVGSDLSFAVALLNQEGNGVVLSSIHNREEARVYAKPVNFGQSTYSLTGEEKEVIAKAMNGEKI